MASHFKILAETAEGRVQGTWIERHRTFAFAWIALTGVGAMLALAVANRASWGVDFSQFYTAGSLAGSGRLYDWNIVQSLELQHAPNVVPFFRLPAFALGLKPLSMLPYSPARVLFLCLEIASLAGFVALWPFSNRALASAVICWSVPVAICVALGQDSVLILFFAALGLWLLLKEKHFWAGIAFSMCASKPHLTLLIPVVLAAKGKYKALLGGACGGFVLVALSFAVEGSQWPYRLFTLTRSYDIEAAPDRMPNLHGLLSFFGSSFPFEITLGLGVVAAIWFVSRRVTLKSAVALALAGGLLLSHHAYSYDAVLAIPSLLLPFEEPFPEWMRMWAVILFTPVAYIFLLSSVELPAHLMISGYTFGLLAVGVRDAHRSP